MAEPAVPGRSQGSFIKRAQSLTKKQVLDELKANGINNLDDLVDARLDALKKIGPGSLGWSVLVYRNFILADSEFKDDQVIGR